MLLHYFSFLVHVSIGFVRSALWGTRKHRASHEPRRLLHWLDLVSLDSYMRCVELKMLFQDKTHDCVLLCFHEIVFRIFCHALKEEIKFEFHVLDVEHIYPLISIQTKFCPAQLMKLRERLVTKLQALSKLQKNIRKHAHASVSITFVET